MRSLMATFFRAARPLQARFWLARCATRYSVLRWLRERRFRRAAPPLTWRRRQFPAPPQRASDRTTGETAHSLDRPIRRTRRASERRRRALAVSRQLLHWKASLRRD